MPGQKLSPQQPAYRNLLKYTILKTENNSFPNTLELRNLIIHLIQQDLKHHQLTENLRQIGLDDNGLYTLDIMSSVAHLMKVPEKIRDEWVDLYSKFMEEANFFVVEEEGHNLQIVAGGCFDHLQRFIHNNP